MKNLFSFKNILQFLLILIIFCSCVDNSRNKTKDNLSQVDTLIKNPQISVDTFCCKKIQYSLKNVEVDTSGIFSYFNDDIDHILPSGLDLDENFIYILDTYESDIKRINLNTFELNVSESVPDENHNMLFDLLVFQDNIICTTIGGEIILFNKQLEIISFKKITRGPCYLYYNNKELFDVFCPHDRDKIYSLNKELLIKSERIENLRGNDKLRRIKSNNSGKEIIIDNKTIYLLDSKYEGEKFGEKNLAFANEVLVFFSLELDNRKLILNICKNCN